MIYLNRKRFTEDKSKNTVQFSHYYTFLTDTILNVAQRVPSPICIDHQRRKSKVISLLFPLLSVWGQSHNTIIGLNNKQSKLQPKTQISYFKFGKN